MFLYLMNSFCLDSWEYHSCSKVDNGSVILAVKITFKESESNKCNDQNETNKRSKHIAEVSYNTLGSLDHLCRGLLGIESPSFVWKHYRSIDIFIYLDEEFQHQSAYYCTCPSVLRLLIHPINLLIYKELFGLRLKM